MARLLAYGPSTKNRRNMLRTLKRMIRRYRLRHAQVLDLPEIPCLRRYGWAMWPAPLRSDSVVYSFGVGDSVGWDLEMIRRFGVTVHAFDPTPASIEWVSRQTLPPQFVFHDYGLANFDGSLNFYPPRRAGNTHFSHVRRSGLFDRRPAVPGQVRRLSTIMNSLGHRRIDVLKIDVEGAEFDALPDFLTSGIQIDQLLVEIHYHFPSQSFRKGLALIDQIKSIGMRCFDVSPRGFEFSFIREPLVPQDRILGCQAA